MARELLAHFEARAGACAARTRLRRRERRSSGIRPPTDHFNCQRAFCIHGIWTALRWPCQLAARVSRRRAHGNAADVLHHHKTGFRRQLHLVDFCHLLHRRMPKRDRHVLAHRCSVLAECLSMYVLRRCQCPRKLTVLASQMLTPPPDLLSDGTCISTRPLSSYSSS